MMMSACFLVGRQNSSKAGLTNLTYCTSTLSRSLPLSFTSRMTVSRKINPVIRLYYFGYFQKRLTYLQNQSVFSQPLFNNQKKKILHSNKNKLTNLNNATNVLVCKSHNGYVVLICIYSFIIFLNVTQH